MKYALIVAGGRIETEFGREYLERYTFDLIVAVDSGMQFFYDIKMKPDLIVGDFDSVNDKVLEFFESQKGISWIRLNPHKDDTDTDAAVWKVIERGYEKIHILGGAGSRLDHTFGNLGLLSIGPKTGTEILLVDSHNRIRMIKDTMSILKKDQFGDYISLIPFTSQVTGVTLTGMKYPLNNSVLECSKTVGISNEIVEDKAVITLKTGMLMVIESKD